jgi:hypothetical protein
MAILNLRASSIDKYLDCPRMMVASTYPQLLKNAGYEVKETKKWVTPGIGTAIHSGCEHLNKHWMANHTQPNSDVILEAVEKAMATFKRNLLKDMETSEVHYTAKFPDNTFIRSHITEYVNLYAVKVLPTRNVEQAELSFKIPIDDNFQVTSTLDAYGDKTLFDLKTGDVITPAHGQIGTYVWLLRQAGHEVLDAQLDYLKRPKQGEPAEHRVIKYNADECEVLAKHAMVKLMQDLQEFQKTGDINVILYNPKSTSCNPIFCPLYGSSSCGGWKDK